MTERPRGRTAASVGQGSVDEVELLLTAAEAVLATSGYEGLRVDDVLAEAGLSTRAFYRHLRGKSELFLALFDREAARAGERLRRKVAERRLHSRTTLASLAAPVCFSSSARSSRRSFPTM